MPDGIKIRMHPSQAHTHFGATLRDVPMQYGLPAIEVLSAEIEGYTDILLGRVVPPIDNGVATMMEVANAYFARASEIDMLIHKGERDGSILRGSPYYRFRTGELRSFLDLTKRSFELGSRLITVEQMRLNERMDAGMLR